MKIQVNGLSYSFEITPTVADLLIKLGLQGKNVAVECNGEIVPKSTHAAAKLADGDRLEIVVAVGGG